MAVIGIANDEETHSAKLKGAGVEVADIAYSISSIHVEDVFIYVDLIETMEIQKGEMEQEVSIEHCIEILYNEINSLTIVSDKYLDPSIGFKSCSYVVESEPGVELQAAGGASLCIEYIASCEVGYLEKASSASLDDPTANAGNANYTKYGAWYGINPGPWCAMFVSWCADQANVSTSIIPKYASVDDGRNTFINWGKYQKSSAYGGTYTPKEGDIFFTGTEADASHTGIVVSVSGSTMTVIDGNSGNQVKQRTMSLSDSSLLGFGTPAYASSAHQWITYGLGYTCTNCGIVSSFPYSLGQGETCSE